MCTGNAVLSNSSSTTISVEQGRTVAVVCSSLAGGYGSLFWDVTGLVTAPPIPPTPFTVRAGENSALVVIPTSSLPPGLYSFLCRDNSSLSGRTTNETFSLALVGKFRITPTHRSRALVTNRQDWAIAWDSHFHGVGFLPTVLSFVSVLYTNIYISCWTSIAKELRKVDPFLFFQSRDLYNNSVIMEALTAYLSLTAMNWPWSWWWQMNRCLISWVAISVWNPSMKHN